MTPRPTISLKTAAKPAARERVASFGGLDEVWAALDALAPKRAPTRAEWLAAIARSPRERECAEPRDGA